MTTIQAKLFDKNVFNFNMKYLNYWHFQRKWWMLLISELGRNFGMDYVHIKHQPNLFINADFITLFT